MPKYIWRCLLRDADQVRFELLFDATDMNRGNYFLCAVPFDKAFYALTMVAAAQLSSMSTMKNRMSLPILNWCASELNNILSKAP